MRNFTSLELHDKIGQALAEVSRRLASGELDRSGRYYSDDELAAGAATGMKAKPKRRIGSHIARPGKKRSANSG
jgi:hypothetical protein